MKINKLIKSEIKRQYFFLKGSLSLDVDYFINKIEQGVIEKNNLNYKTNLHSFMTSYTYFLEDKNFVKIILPITDMIDHEKLNEADNNYHLRDAWGYKQCFGHFTQMHHHIPNFLSGVITLNKHNQSLHFPQINETLECEPGNFILFSSFLMHGNNRNTSNECRYGISFNFKPGVPK
jgi:hypothetical protein